MQIFSTPQSFSESIPNSWMEALNEMGLTEEALEGPSPQILENIRNYSLQLVAYPIQQTNQTILINLN